MPRKSAALVIALLATFWVSAFTTAQEGSTQRSFTGDTVNMDLSPGQYQVTASADDRIRVYSGQEARQPAGKLSVRLDVNLPGTRADVTVRPQEERSEVRIELPKGVNMVVAFSGGSLRLSGVEGNKDITAKAGVIEISVGDGSQYTRNSIRSKRRSDCAGPRRQGERCATVRVDW
jgi:hypothetical protein